MNKISSKYRRFFTFIILSIGLLNSGCFQFSKGAFWKSESDGNSKEERINALEEKMASLTYSLGNLTTENYELKNKLNKLEDHKSQLDKEYTQLKEKQANIERTQTSNNTARSQLQGELADTKEALENIIQQLASMEAEKNSLKAKLTILEASGATTTKTDTTVDNTSDIAVKENSQIQSRETLIKETQEKRKSTLVDELLNKAIELYRQEKFEDAIGKWEEVLALDPSKLEAKFNIEVAQDRIKEKQIQEELDAIRIQRK